MRRNQTWKNLDKEHTGERTVNANAMRYKQAWPVQRARSRPVWLAGRSERLAGPGHTGPYDHMQCDCILNAKRRVSQRQVTGSHVHVERTAQAAGEHGLEQGKSGGRETEEPLYQWL